MIERGQLTVAALRMTLPCSRECPFGLQCAPNYVGGACTERINSFVSQNVYGKPGEKIIKIACDIPEIHFDTTDPLGKVVIKQGFVTIGR